MTGSMNNLCWIEGFCLSNQLFENRLVFFHEIKKYIALQNVSFVFPSDIIDIEIEKNGVYHLFQIFEGSFIGGPFT